MSPGEEVAGKYRVDRVLGAGAMGVVVRAWHIDLDQEVAIKFLHPELASKADSAERFRREARSAVRIPSDHVARVLDVGTLPDSNIPFIVMEYLRGRDLARLLSERGPLPVPLAVRFLLEACDAVGDAHARGIVHRDLKPANLFVVDRPGGGQMIKVLDFGISKTLSDGPRGLSITEPATLMGSPGYMSPEQLESSRNVDARTDIWSLGVILYEMVTGSLPFDGDSVPQLVRAVISGQRAPLAGHARELEPVVARCLHQDRNARFQNIIELCDALLPFVREAPSPSRTVESAGVQGSAGLRGSEPGSTVAPPEQPAPPDGPWGRTHGVRRSPLWRTLGLAALVGAVGAAAFWRGQDAMQTFARPSEAAPVAARDRTDQVTPALQPAPNPAARAEPDAPATAASGEPTSAANGAAKPHVSPLGLPMPDVPSPPPSGAPATAPSVPPAGAEAAPKATSRAPEPPAPVREDPAPLDFGAALGTATGALPSTAKKPLPTPAPAATPKPEGPRPEAPKPPAPSTGAPVAAAPSAPVTSVPAEPAPERDKYEIEGFGGRK